MNIWEDTTTAVNTLTLEDSPYAAVFAGITPAIDRLFVRSDNLDDLLTRPRVAIVGSRKITPYGRKVTADFAGELARHGVVVVSGLAYGVDAIAHQAALDAGGLTIAVLPSSLEKIYPAAHTALAERIVGQGGALISEYPPGSTIAYKNQFIERNRIVCGMSNALLITEAAVDSGTMHTAGFAIGQGKDVLAVPGNIYSATSAGTHNLIKTGAALARSVADVLAVLGMTPLEARQALRGGSANEQLILDLLGHSISDGEQLLVGTQLPINQFNQAMTMMEITGKIKALGNNHWALR